MNSSLKIFIYPLLALAAFLQQLPAQAVAPCKFDTPEIRAELSIDKNLWIPDADEIIPERFKNMILKNAREFQRNGQYDAALKELLRADSLCPDPQLNLEMASCYAHLNQKSNALKRLENVPDYSWKVKADVYETLGLHEEALQACADLSYLFAEPILLKSQLLIAHGNHDEGVKCALEGYWHFERLDRNPEQFEPYFRQLGVTLTPPPEVTTNNERVLKFLHSAITLKPPSTELELEQLFDRKFRDFSQDSKHLNMETLRESQQTFSYVRLINYPNQESIRLTVSPNLNSTFISLADVRAYLSKSGVKSITETENTGTYANHGPKVVCGRGTDLSCSIGNGSLQFHFSRAGQLTEISKDWSKSAAEIKHIATNQNWEWDSDLDGMETATTKGQYERSIRELLTFWDSTGQKEFAPHERYRLMSRKRDLLVRCYDGIGLAGIASFLKAAPLEHITSLKFYALQSIEKGFPTYEQYMKSPWMVIGPADKNGGQYIVYAFGKECFSIHSGTAIYATFFKMFGPIVGDDRIKTSPLPGALMDSVTFAEHIVAEAAN